MRAYIDGTLSTKQQSFLPEDLWFATNDCEDNMDISDTCIRLTGLEIESAVLDEGSKFTCRWKGVELSHIDDQGECVETEEFSIEDFKEFVEGKNMRLVNMGTYLDQTVNVKITSLVLVDDDVEYEFDTSCIDEIEIIDL